jgi:lipopolysaccharide/colanic/teichoic acid biosynthesis glycosyltransferase
MPRSKPLKGAERNLLLSELYKKYGQKHSLNQRFIYYRKKYSWIIIIGFTKFLKRTFDIIFSALSLIIASPLFLLISLLIKLEDGGSVFYISQRVGKWGKEFSFPKFRSMKEGAEHKKKELLDHSDHKNEKTFKMKGDPRITKIGKILRKTSLDELPQLWCVLQGEMSLVGPRPPLPQEVAMYTLEERRRLDVTPGLTCIWQVSGRSEIPFSKQVKLDVSYIESQSFWMDIKLLLKTIPAVILGRGAY